MENTFFSAFPSFSAVPSNRSEPIHRDGTLWIYAILIIIILIAGIIFSNQGKSWAQTLKKPSFSIPEPFTIIIWVVIYFLLGWSALIGYRSAPTGHDAMLINLAFVINLGLNLLWLMVFFQQKDLRMSFWILILLLLSTIWLAWLVYRVNRMAGSLLLIYIVWLIFLSIYSWQLMSLN
jgi:tryptophan-rich sensory protein